VKQGLSVVVPCFNEAKSLPAVLPELIAFINDREYNLVIVNDGSKDDSLKIIDEHFEGQSRCKVVNHKVNRGYGGAIKSGILATESIYCITIDADGQHLLEDVDKLYNIILENNADMVVGSRKGLQEASAFRGFGKSIIRNIAKFLMPVNVFDINSGMKIYNAELAKKYLPLIPNSMAFSDIITLVFINQRNLVMEEPIRIKSRVAGESTINIRTAYDTLLEIINIVMLFNPMRIFLPLATFFFLAGFIWEIPILLRGVGVSVGAGMLMALGMLFFMLGLITEQLSQIRKMLINQ